MISFYPGPSRVHDEIPKYVNDAFTLGIMSINHRSEDFVKMSEKTIRLLHEKLNIPKNYTVFFTGSATECWEIIAQSVITDQSFHLYNGAFGQKWFDYTHRLRQGARGIPFNREEKLNPANIKFAQGSVICVTQNETSNGTQVSNAIISKIKKNNAKSIVAVDATSSMAGIKLDFKAADIWFASVQKCFGLPAGLALLICSPQAMALVKSIGEKNHYNSLTFMDEMMNKWQTPFTPNVLGIYLLMRVIEKAKPIETIHALVEKRARDWTEFLTKRKNIYPLVHRKTVRSLTVIPVTGNPETLKRIKQDARNNGILIGEGYGEWKSTTFRIANFPALKQHEITKLKTILRIF